MNLVKILMICFLVGLIIPQPAFSNAKFSGSIKSAAKINFKRADLILKDVNKNWNYHQTNNDGSFSFEVPEGFYDLIIAAVDHKPISKKIYVKDNENYSFNIELSTLNLIYELPYYRMYGNFNDYNHGTALYLDSTSDGTYQTIVENGPDTLIYKITGASKYDVNGTQADFFIPDSNGFYFSGIIIKSYPAKISYSPDQLNQLNDSVIFECSSRFLEDYESILKMNPYFMRIAVNTINNDTVNYDTKLADSSLSELFATYKKILAEKDPGLRIVILSGYLDLISMYLESFPETVHFRPEYLHELKNLLNSNIKLRKSYIVNYVSLSVLLNENPEHSEFINEILADTTKTQIRKMLLERLIKYTYEDINNYDKAYKYLEMYEKYYSDEPFFSALKRRYNKDKEILIGRQIPDFELFSIDGKTKIKYSDFKGKYLLIDIWATWCAPCVKEMRNLHQIAEKYLSEKFEMLSISIDRNKDDLNKFLNEKWQMPWYNSWEKGDWNSYAAKVFEVTGVPTPILVNPDGKIIELGSKLRGVKLLKTLQKYLE